MNASRLPRFPFLANALGKRRQLALLGVLLGPACGETPFFGSTPTQTLGAPVLHVLPEVFLGQVRCRPGEPGMLSSYAVDLVDPTVSTDAGLGSHLGSSIAVRCDREVEFSVPSGRPYALGIRAYDVSASEVRAAELEAEPVQPKWRAQCGGRELVEDAGADQLGPIVSIQGRLFVRSCTTLQSTASSAGAEVHLVDALGALQCGPGAGQVSRFTAEVAGQSASAACGDSVFFDGLVPGSYSVAVTARQADVLGDAGAEPSGASSDCTVDPVPEGDAGAERSDAGAPPVGTGDGVASRCPDAGSVTAAASGRWTTTCELQVVEGRRATAICGVLTPQ